jgi:hypothetical protein
MQLQTKQTDPRVPQMPVNSYEESRIWTFTEPPLELIDTKLQLLTIGKVSVAGLWCGQHGEHFVAWALLDMVQ